MIRALLSSLLVVTLMSACGGGGGGGDSIGSEVTPVVTPTSATVTGLVPQAPSQGATLYANAADLRPMINGARWQYRGILTRDGMPSTRYVSSVDQKLVNGLLQETENAVFLDSNDVSTVGTASGNVVVQVKDPLGIGSDEVATVTELRSPIRVDDQITQFDRIDVPTGTDVDGDGKADVADIAIYSRVIGPESVDLPELARTVSAVKVETTAAVRFKKSSDGSALPVRTVVQTQWYAAGIGVVRHSLGAPMPGGNVPAISYDERLFSWDGVTQGLGALGPQAVQLPSTSYPVTLPSPLAATTVGDHALVLAKSLQPTDPNALTFAVLDCVFQRSWTPMTG